MQYLTRSVSHPGHWLLGQQELAPEDVIEVLILGKWYRAHVHHDMGLREYRLLVAGLTHSLPLTEDTPARWLGTDGDGRTEDKAESEAG